MLCIDRSRSPRGTVALAWALAVAAGVACGDASPPGKSGASRVPGEGESAQSQHGAPASNETTPSEGDPTPDEAAGGSAPKATPLGYGWTAMVTGDNFDPGAVDRVGSATSALAGQTIRAIVTDPNVRVRSDDLACASCHDWANAIDRAAFCARTDAFMVQPVAKEDGTDPPNAKPRMLRSLLFAWRAAGCP